MTAATNASWTELARRASLASHQLIGWIFWDPRAIELYAELGVPNGLGYYVASRAAPLAPAGDRSVIAAFYSIRAQFIRFALGLAREHTTFEAVYDARNRAVAEGMRAHFSDVCEPLASMAGALWEAADALPLDGRVLAAAHLDWPRGEDDPVVSAWLAANAIREWRGDTHWAVLASEDITGAQAGLLHNAWMGYPSEWIPRSRGADDTDLAAAYEGLAERGFVTDGRVNERGLEFRQLLEDRTDALTQRAWRHLGRERTARYLEIVEPMAARSIARIDLTAGTEWMPAARPRRLA